MVADVVDKGALGELRGNGPNQPAKILPIEQGRLKSSKRALL